MRFSLGMMRHTFRELREFRRPIVKKEIIGPPTQPVKLRRIDGGIFKKYVAVATADEASNGARPENRIAGPVSSTAYVTSTVNKQQDIRKFIQPGPPKYLATFRRNF